MQFLCKIPVRLALLAVAGTLMLPAQQPSKAQVEAFRLSLQNIESTVHAYQNVLEALSADGDLLRRTKVEIGKTRATENTNGHDSLNMTMTRIVSREPKLAAAYAKAGISPQQAGMVMETVTGSLLAVSMADSAKVDTGKLPSGFVAENIEFVRKNKDKVIAIFQQFEASSKRFAAVARELDDKHEAGDSDSGESEK